MFKRKKTAEPFDRENQKPTIRSSICTGEQVAGFKHTTTGKFTEIMVIRNQKDMDEFLSRFGIRDKKRMVASTKTLYLSKSKTT